MLIGGILPGKINYTYKDEFGYDNAEYKELEERLLIMQDIKSSSKSLWNIFMKHGENGRIPIPGTTWFLRDVADAYLMLDQLACNFSSWIPTYILYERNDNRFIREARQFPTMEYIEDKSQFLATYDIYEALGVKHYFKYLKGSYDSNDDCFWESFFNFPIALCLDNIESYPGLANSKFLEDVFGTETCTGFERDVMQSYFQRKHNEWYGYRQYLVWKNVQDMASVLRKKREEVEQKKHLTAWWLK